MQPPKEWDNLKKQFTILSDELRTLRDNENYFEKDIKQSIKKLQQLKYNIEHFSIEVDTNEIPRELISIKSITQPVTPAPVPTPTPPLHFIDQLIRSQKPKVSIDISRKKLGRMCTISDELIAFYSPDAFPSLNIRNYSWESLETVYYATELHWSDYLKKFLVLGCSQRKNQPNQLYEFDPYDGTCEEFWEKSPDWNSGWGDNFITLTCFKEHVLIVLGTCIEKWLANCDEWYDNSASSTRWCPPISCQTKSDEIKCIRMNDLYYAVIIEEISSKFTLTFELRNHGMATLHRIPIAGNASPSGIRLFCLPNESGWLFFLDNKPRRVCYVLDNNMKQYDQNVVLSSKVTDIVVQNNLIFLRKNNTNNNKEVFEVYDWQRS